LTLIALLALGAAGTWMTLRSTPSPRMMADTTTTSTSVPAVPFDMSFAGDTELGSSPIVPSNPAAYLQPLRSALHAPIEFANLEGTMTARGYSKCGVGHSFCYAFRVPTATASAYASMGFNVLNSANNHSHDFGSVGAADTSNALIAAGISQTGLPGQIAYRTIEGRKIAIIGFAPYSSTNNLLNSVAARQLITFARTHADFVVVYMHTGAEGSSAVHVTGSSEFYVGENRGNPLLFAHNAVDAGADLVVASGPHVLRGMEFYHHHLIAYSLGNFVNYQNFGTGGVLSLSGILHVALNTNGTVHSASFVSVTLTRSGQGIPDPSGAALRLVKNLSTEDFGANAAQFSPSGIITPPAKS
jgi:hypothetical protein